MTSPKRLVATTLILGSIFGPGALHAQTVDLNHLTSDNLNAQPAAQPAHGNPAVANPGALRNGVRPGTPPQRPGGNSQMTTQMPAQPPIVTGPPIGASQGSYGGPPRVDMSSMIFHFYFDFWLINRPGFYPLTFQNVHSVNMIEILPREDVQFSAEISSTPRFYEIRYAPVGKKWAIKFGKIWVPFDDVNPHNHFGGRMNTRQLMSGNQMFLPTIWTDLGIAYEQQLARTKSFKATAVVYVVNGFPSGGQDPAGRPPGGGTYQYPNFDDIPVNANDNNSDKAVGARLQMQWGQTFQLGISGYTERWSDDNSPSKRLTLLGVDGSINLGRTEFRAGVLNGTVSVFSQGGTMNKGGAYAEWWQKYLSDQTLRTVVRGGILQDDDRFIDTNDSTQVGVGIFYRPNFIQYSLEHDQELNKIVGRKGYPTTWARVSILL